jgi:hypothetical protein
VQKWEKPEQSLGRSASFAMGSVLRTSFSISGHTRIALIQEVPSRESTFQAQTTTTAVY